MLIDLKVELHMFQLVSRKALILTSAVYTKSYTPLCQVLTYIFLIVICIFL